MNYTKETYLTKDEWLKNRGIGGSDASAIVGRSKWTTTNDIFNRIVRGKEKSIPETDKMKRGTVGEDYIRKIFALDHPECKVKNPPRKGYWLFRRNDYPLITCTPDGLFTRDGKKYGLEIKYVEVVKREDKDIWNNNSLPDQYYFQCLQYLIVLDDLDGVVLDAHLIFKRFNDEDVLEFDHSEQKEYLVSREDCKNHIRGLLTMEKKFIDENIKKGIRPPVKITF